jgi:hypothetical protein
VRVAGVRYGARHVEGNPMQQERAAVRDRPRARNARLRLEQLERLLVPDATVAASWLRRVLGLFSFGRSGEGSQTSRTRGPLKNWPRMPGKIQQGWIPIGTVKIVATVTTRP